MAYQRISIVLTLTVGMIVGANSAKGDLVEVVVTGEVEWNGINPAPLGNVNVGDDVLMTFLVDSDNFANGPNFPTRGYIIDEDSFSMTLGSTVVGLEDPFPFGQQPYFVIRDNDPAVDGFLVSKFVDSPFGVPIDVAGIFGQFIDNFYVTYGGETLPSLDILDALGTYDFTGLTVFNWTINDGPVKPLGILFTQLTISLPCPADFDGDGTVGASDLAQLLGSWGPYEPCPPHDAADFDGDCVVNAADLAQLLGSWGPCE